MDRRLFLGGLSSALGAFWFGIGKPTRTKPMSATPVASGLAAVTAPNSGGAFTGGPGTLSTTVTCTGTHRLLIVWVARNNHPWPAIPNGTSLVDYDGSPMTNMGTFDEAYPAGGSGIANGSVTDVFWTTTVPDSATLSTSIELGDGGGRYCVAWATFSDAYVGSPLFWTVSNGYNGGFTSASVEGVGAGITGGSPTPPVASASTLIYGMLQQRNSTPTPSFTPVDVTDLDGSVNTFIPLTLGGYNIAVHAYRFGDGTDTWTWGYNVAGGPYLAVLVGVYETRRARAFAQVVGL